MCKNLVTLFALVLLLNLNVAEAGSTSTAAPKSKRTARVYSLLSTLVPVVVGGALLLREGESAPRTCASIESEHAATLTGLAIGSAGIVLGPGAGHVYAVKMGRFWNGVAIRGIVASLTGAILFSATENSDFGAGIVTAAIALVVGSSVCLVSMTHDISTLGASVDDYNKEHGFSRLTLKPTYFPANKAPGLMLTLSL